MKQSFLTRTCKKSASIVGNYTVAVDGPTILGFVIGIIQERKNQHDVIDFTFGRITELYVDEVVRG